VPDRVLPGFYLQHKPPGVTSFDLVRGLQDEIASAGLRLRSCHGGVLDPFAEGLMVLLVGQATRLMDLLHPLPKTYRALVRWGTETDTGDGGGKATSSGDAGALTPDRLAKALAPFLGWTDQVPPATSNKRIDGERAYVRAHRGEVVELPPSKVYLHAARWLEHDLPRTSRLEIVCRGGYYVRALVRDLGRAVGCPAHLEALQRTAIGAWSDAPGERHHLAGAALMPWCATRPLTDADVGLLRQGTGIPGTGIAAPAWSPPRGFPDPQGPVLGLHLGKLASLLELRNALLYLKLELRGGL
jgi:tRNA pseudouridine55 synthase